MKEDLLRQVFLINWALSSWGTDFEFHQDTWLVVWSQLRRLQAGLMLQLLWASSVWHRQANGYSLKLTLVITDSLTPTSPPPTSVKPSLNCYRCFLQKSNLTSAAVRRPHVAKCTFHETVSSPSDSAGVFIWGTVLNTTQRHTETLFVDSCVAVGWTLIVLVSSSLCSLVKLNCSNPQRSMWILCICLCATQKLSVHTASAATAQHCSPVKYDCRLFVPAAV